jgi:glutamate dehydrogenase
MREAAGVSQSPADPWVQHLARLLEKQSDDPVHEAQAFASRVTPAYMSSTPPRTARDDLAELSELLRGGGSSGDADDAAPLGALQRLAAKESDSEACTFRLRRYGTGRISLTTLLPVLESFGLVVVESIPWRVGPEQAGGPEGFIDDIGVKTDSPWGPEALRFVPAIHGPRLVEALGALAKGDSDVDALNKLVILAGLEWRQVTVLRAYARYSLQIAGGAISTERALGELTAPLARYPDVARALTGYFLARFDPDHPSAAEEERAVVDRRLCIAQLDMVENLPDDRVLRTFLSLIDATLRTNYFRSGFSQPVPGEEWHVPLVLKLDSRRVPGLPQPKPLVEAFVHSPRVEGIHLRAGLVARGGLRWSERPDDFRTEVLDLAFAQVKKNAIIVPTGAKGGFVCRAPQGGQGATSRPAPAKVAACYEEFVWGLLDITDNIVGETVVTPSRVVAYDAPDPYLVVAADKGTATFSDLANSIAARAGFWLGDAFASGGSHGYDHKAMGITARGAWVSVRRHFRELGIDVQHDPIRVVGVGDMSGDVFGNGMLQSGAIRLVAAFDHRHVFLDPQPDGETSFAERKRLATLSSSSWADYDLGLISPGGGVWRRDVKSVPLTPAVQRVLGVSTEALSPPELIPAILAAPVDLLWFGGIGTFVKAPDETDANVGDRDNDAVRITSDQVRARVVAEGANLGVTQKARIRYSRRGGRINTDFIDNAAGVATSDREVNLKILLSLAVETGALDPDKRDDLLRRSEGEVADQVLLQVDHSVAALNRAARPEGSARELDAYEAVIDALEASGAMNRDVEVLPSAEELQVRREAGAGLIRPELAVVLAYAKSDLVNAIESSTAPADPGLHGAVVPYFPEPIREEFADLIPRHRLYRRLVATDVAGELVDRVGIVWAHESSAEVGCALQDAATAFWAARRVTGADELWADLDSRANALGAEAESLLHSVLARAVASLARAYMIRAPGAPVDETVASDARLADEISEWRLARGAGHSSELDAARVAPGVASRYLAAESRAEVADVGPIARASSRPVTDLLTGLDQFRAATGVANLSRLVTASWEAAPSPGRYRLWQGRALLDDLSALLRKAATAALSARPGSAADEAIAAWLAPRADKLVPIGRLALSPVRGGRDPLALASVCVRRLQGLLEP